MAVVRLDLVALVDVHVAHFVILFIAARELDDCAICLSTLQGPSVRDGKKEGSRAFSVF
jgi:predicted membrane-bound dolichyl-phosphate-mannose-protein mannosyltransferase